MILRKSFNIYNLLQIPIEDLKFKIEIEWQLFKVLILGINNKLMEANAHFLPFIKD